MSGMMDRDGDGTISEEEMSRFPQSMRDRMGLAGVRSISVKDFSEKATARFQERLNERNEDREREAKSKTSTGSTVFQQRKREKFAPQLPKEYAERDADEDGQIALFEWAAWERSEMAAFFEMDANEDGFLAPKELKGDESSVAFNRDRLAVSGGTSSSSRRGGGTSTSRLRLSGSSDSSSSSSSRTSSRGRGTDRDSSDRGTSDRGRSWGDRGGSDRSRTDRGGSSRGRSWGGDRGGSFERSRSGNEDRGGR
jgi:hypothetical protein